MRTFLKYILVLVIVAVAMFEVGSPLWSRSAAAGAADDAANVAARDYFDSANIDSARTEAAAAAAIRGATLTKIELLQDGSIKVTVKRNAKSYVLHHISALKNWYNVTATATAAPLRS